MMNELRAIVRELERGEPCVLATIVETHGSTYRRAGARLLVTRAGRSVGCISGGCLERDVAERAASVIEGGKTVTVTYDATASADIVFGLGLGCRGVVRLLLEPLGGISDEDKTRTHHLNSLVRAADERATCALATVIYAEEGVAARVGSRLLLARSKSGKEAQVLLCDIAAPALAARVLANAENALDSGRSSVERFEMTEGVAEVFIEVVEPPVPLVVFGAGADVSPLVDFAKRIGWHVTIVSPGAAARRELFSDADEIVSCRPEEMATRVPIDVRTMCVVMTHNYLEDKEALRLLLPSPARYIGVLGPLRRTDELLRDLSEESVEFAEDKLRRLYAPVGLDIGADSPEEVALAILAEARAVIAGRAGGMLRLRDAPLHDMLVHDVAVFSHEEPRSTSRQNDVRLPHEEA